MASKIEREKVSLRERERDFVSFDLGGHADHGSVVEILRFTRVVRSQSLFNNAYYEVRFKNKHLIQ
jgi:hypothetical protein